MPKTTRPSSSVPKVFLTIPISLVAMFGIGITGVYTAHAQQVVDQDQTWTLITSGTNGTNSVSSLTKAQCEFARARSLGLPANDEEKARYAVHKQAQLACKKKVGISPEVDLKSDDITYAQKQQIFGCLLDVPGYGDEAAAEAASKQTNIKTADCVQ